MFQAFKRWRERRAFIRQAEARRADLLLWLHACADTNREIRRKGLVLPPLEQAQLVLTEIACQLEYVELGNALRDVR
jgi:hypothetical protein